VFAWLAPAQARSGNSQQIWLNRKSSRDDESGNPRSSNPGDPMSIGSIGSAGSWPTQQSATFQSNWQNVINAASGTLGLSASALKQRLQSGSSLSTIAQSQGVSQQTLVSSISSALTQNGSTATGTQLQQIATNIANRTPGGHHHHAGGGASLLDPTSGTSSTGSTSSSSDSSSATSSTEQSFLAALAAGSQSDSSALFSTLLDPSSSSASNSGAADPATQSDLWQGIDLSA
jgi:hypothetical protein